MDQSGPAFPTGDDYQSLGNAQYYSPGMSLRDWFAGKCDGETVRDLIGGGSMSDAASLIGMPIDEYAKDPLGNYIKLVAKVKYMYADAMITENRRTDGVPK